MRLSKKTNKLFYDRYVNKISIYYDLAEDFRNSEIENLQITFDSYKLTLENSKGEPVNIGRWHKRPLTQDNLAVGIRLVDILRANPDFSIRVEGRILSIYSNDDSVIDSISKISGVSIRYMSMPANSKIKDFLLKNPKKIISKEYTHKYKVTVNPLRDQEENFREWAKKLPKIKLNSKSLRRSDGYFYVEDEKTLGLCRLFLSNRIRRIDELVREDEI